MASSGGDAARRARRALPYLGVALVALVLAALVLQLWHADLGIPFYYSRGGDALTVLASFKLIAETGWITQTDKLGMPFGAEFYGYPSTSDFHQVAMRILLTLFPNPAVAMNIYFLLGFPVTAVGTLYVLRRFNLSVSAAATVAILYSFLPYRFFRNESHLFYASYFLVPFAIMVALWVSRGEPLFNFSKDTSRTPAARITRRGWLSLTVCLSLASDNPYHTFFFVAFVASAAFIAFVRFRCISAHAVPAAILIATVFFGFAMNLSPALWHNATHPGPAVAYRRAPADAETYALTLAQLILPIQEHRLPALAAIRTKYDSEALAVNENGSVSLGAIGTLGFLFLAGWLILGSFARRKTTSLFDDLAAFNAIAFALATFGGVGALVAFYLTDSLRAYNRIAPFIAFLSLFAIALLLDRAIRRRPLRQIWTTLGLAALVLVGVLDQTSSASPPYTTSKSSFTSMQRFVAGIEASVPPGTSIFELPVIPFPEEIPRSPVVPPSEELTPFLHSRSLRWSYGSFRDSASGRYQMRVPKGSTQALLFKLAVAGFGGLLIDRTGYADSAISLERELRPIVRAPPLQSEDGNWLFFNLRQYVAGLHERLGPERFSYASQFYLNQPDVQWRKGCSYPEDGPDREWRWCGPDAILAFPNASGKEKRLPLSMDFATRVVTPSLIHVDSPFGPTILSATINGSHYAANIVLPPHETFVMHIHSDAPQIPSPGDARTLVFQILNLSVQNTATVDRLIADFALPQTATLDRHR
jgi:phosphoglycerol transferase